jgi:outer membrane protein OmpA-like peptidoglycan-associated protein
MNNCTLFVIFIGLFFAKNTTAQTHKSPLDAFTSPELARVEFDKKLRGNDGDKVYANVGLAHYWLTVDSLRLAFRHADTAEKSFPELNEKRQSQLAEKHITPASTRTLVTDIIKLAYEKAKSEGDFVAWDDFLRNFPKPAYGAVGKFYTEGSKNRNEQLCFRLKKMPLDELQTTLAAYETDLRRQTPDCFRSASARQLALSFKDKPWAGLDDFFKKNPKHPLSRDTARRSFVAAMSSRNARQMFDFAKRNPESGFVSIATDSGFYYVFPDLLKRGKLDELMRFHQQFPQSSYIAQLDAFFAREISEKDVVLPFRREVFGEFSLKSLPKTADALYAFYRNYGTVWGLDQFVEQHIDIPFDKGRIDIDRDLFKLSESRDKTEEYIKKAAPTYGAFRALQRLIYLDVKNQKWANAAAIVRQYAPFFPADDKRVKMLLEVLERPLSNVTAEKLSPNVNSFSAEYCPVISADNKTLYFCRRTSQEDVYVSHRDGKGDWTPAEICRGLDSPNSNEAPMTLSADGNEMLLFKEGQLLFTEKTSEGTWTRGRDISPNINTVKWQAESSFSADGKVLIFESRRRDDVLGLKESGFSYGDYRNENIDLFISFKTGPNTWSKAINLGKTINSPFRERSPFLHPDTRTFYFCSEGRGGLGDMDLFKTTRLDSTWLNWSEPIHVGKELNTAGEDWGYKISTNGRYAFYSSNQDIWMATPLPEIARPLPTKVITGVMTGMDNRPVIGALIIIRDKIKGDTITTLKPDPKTGEYAVVIPADREYEAIVVNPQNNYLPVTVDLSTAPSVTGDLERKDDIRLFKKEDVTGAGLNFTFRNLNFDFSKADIKPGSFGELDRWADILKQYKFKAKIEGHTDNVGDDAGNLTLSQRRADAARNYLISKGCNADDIQAIGFGEKQPISVNTTDEGRAINRRVVIQIRQENKEKK